MVHLNRIFQLTFILTSGNSFSASWHHEKQQYSCSLKPFSWIFADIAANGSIFFGLVKTEFFLKPSSRLVYTDFGLISNRVLLFRAFLLLLESITKIRCKPVLLSTVEAVFPASGNGFSIECYLFRLV